MQILDVKTCTKCGEVKHLSRFGVNTTCKGGVSTRCKDCDNAYLRQYYKTNVRKRMLIAARDRASIAGVPFDISEEDIVVPEICPALGLALEVTEGRGGGDASPSLDRIDPALGYVRGNIIVISSKANRIKSNVTADEILAVGGWLKNLVDR